jgi:hypothetical protein
MTDCIKRIVETSKGFFSEKDARQLLDDLEKAALKRRRDGEDFSDALKAEVLERKIKAKEEGLIQKRNAAINLIKTKELDTKINSLLADGLTPKKAVQALLVGVQSNAANGRMSVDAKYKQLSSKFLGGMVNDLEKNSLLSLVTRRALTKEIAEEMWQLSLKEGRAAAVAKITGKSVTGSKEARQIAGIFLKYTDAVRLRQNRAGASIGKVEGFAGTQTHNRARLQKAGFDKWRNDIMPLLNKERTFGDADEEGFLKSAFDGLSSGVHLKAQGADDGKLFQFKGPANLARKISQRRVLHFKGSKEWLEYNDTFGNRDFFEGIMSMLDRGSRNISLMETFGTNPQAMFDKVKQGLLKKFRGDSKALKGLQTKVLDNMYREVDGTTMIADNPTLAQIGSGVRAVQSMAKLGGAVISSITDIPAKASELQFQGVGFLESYGNSLGDILKGRGSKERREISSLVGVGLDGIRGAIFSRFSATDDVPGTISKWQRTFFKLNGLQWWTDVHKIGTGLMMSNRLASMKVQKFTALDEDTQRLFNQFGITDNHWDAIRASTTKAADGNTYITPDAIADIPDDVLLPIARKITGKTKLSDNALIKVREDVEGRLQAYYVDRVDFATITPDARERAILSLGTQRGTGIGEAVRFVTQFKSFPITFISKAYGRALYGKGKADVPALMQLVLLTTLFGYGAMSAKDILKGREPRDPNKPATWTAAMLQGGGLGIMGDFFLGEFNRFGQDALTTAAGPTAGTINDLFKIYASLKAGDDPSSRAVRTMINNTPFANLFYLRPALNYLLLYQIQEALNPGSLRRMERRVQKQNNQKFLFRPSEAVR